MSNARRAVLTCQNDSVPLDLKKVLQISLAVSSLIELSTQPQTWTLQNSLIPISFKSTIVTLFLFTFRLPRRMFPVVKVRLRGLDPEKTYAVFLDMVAVDTRRYRYVYPR